MCNKEVCASSENIEMFDDVFEPDFQLHEFDDEIKKNYTSLILFKF